MKPNTLIDDYFARLKSIYDGEEGAIGRMLELWDDDATCTFVGPPPLASQFRGHMALATLFKSMATQGTTDVETEDGEKVSLGKPEFKVHRTRVRGNKTIAEWDMAVETDDGKSFTVAGSNVFTISDGKIVDLNLVTAPRAGVAAGFKITDLSHLDIGRLALAAWAVV